MRLLKYFPFGIVNSYMVDSPQPVNLNYAWNFGSLLGLSLVIQIITGILLAMNYIASVDLAFSSVEHIMRESYNGWLLRYVHANTASFFFICVYIHLARGIYFSSYRAPRVMVWSIGVIILILIIATGFLGYVLPFGQISLWGATVICNLLSAIPWIGKSLVEFVWGGFSVNQATLNRFFSLHYLLPFVLAALVVLHLMALHSHGSSNPLGYGSNSDKVPMHPYYTFKDLVTVYLYLLLLAFMVFFSPNYMSHPDNYIPANAIVTPSSIVPEWYLLPFYAILRSIDNKMLGVVAMFASLLILLALPILDTSRIRGAEFRPIYQFFFWMLVADFYMLMVLGACHAEEPYTRFSLYATYFYFAWFLVLVPVSGIIENSLLNISSHKTQTSFHPALGGKTKR